MDSGYISPFTRSLLTALFAGLVATLLCIFYDVIYRDQTHFSLSSYVNISTLIFSVNLIFLVFGIVYYLFTLLKKGEILFIVFFLLITALMAILANGIHRSEVPLQNKEFHELFVPIVLIIGLLACFGIPFLYHSKKFREHVL